MLLCESSWLYGPCGKLGCLLKAEGCIPAGLWLAAVPDVKVFVRGVLLAAGGAIDPGGTILAQPISSIPPVGQECAAVMAAAALGLLSVGLVLLAAANTDATDGRLDADSLLGLAAALAAAGAATVCGAWPYR